MIKRLLSVLLAAALLFVSGFAEETLETGKRAEDEISVEPDADGVGDGAAVERDESRGAASVNGYPAREVNAALNIRSKADAFHYTIDFVDYPFWRPATEYDGNLAIMSLTMAMCANRSLNLEQKPEKDFDPSLNVERFFADAGFTDIRKDDYSKETSMYTLSTAIGKRRMEHEGEEPFTLIAVGVCGAFYKNEMQSNIITGNGELHEGFAAAARLVIDRVCGYIMTRGIEGRIKLWISGFSRAAAVSNLVAGELVRDGVLEKEDVFAYTFATPAAVFNPPESGYENIFNIISPMDPVPQIMPAEWGFGRYGRDLFLPLTEFSSLGKAAMEERGRVALDSFGIETAYSPALNLRIRLLFSILLEELKSREQYNAVYLPAVASFVRRRDASNILTTLRGMFREIGKNPDYDRAAMDRMLDYTLRVFGNVLTRTELAATNTNTGSFGVRLLNEHRQDTYLACIDLIRQNLFETDTDFMYVMIRGPVRVRFSRRDGSGAEAVLTDEESVSFDNGSGVDQLLYMERFGNVTVLAVPNDLGVQIEWEATQNGTVEVYQAVCSVFASVRYPGASSGVQRVRTGDRGVAYRWMDGKALLPEGFTAVSFTATELASFIGIASMGVNWRIAVMGVIALLGVLLVLITRLIARLSRKKKPDPLALLSLAAFLVCVLETEAAFWFFADQTAVRALWKAAAGAILIALFFRRRSDGKPLRDTLFPGLLTAVFADVIICFSFAAGVCIYLLAHVLLITSFLRRVPMRKGRWGQWAVVSLAVFGLIVWHFVPRIGLEAWMVAIYAPVLLLMNYSAEMQPFRVRYAARLFVISDVLLGVFVTMLGDPVIHATYMLLFYLALFLMAAGDPKISLNIRRREAGT